MITYNYSCQVCCTSFEISARKFEDINRHPKCPKCGSVSVIKVISVPTIIFKGVGFYKTDNRKGDRE
jgi:putative FmdB family regulatory protein